MSCCWLCHSISDLWSLVVLTHELGLLYTSQRTGIPAPLTPLALHSTDYARWQAELLAGTAGEQLWAYWQQQLAGASPVLDLPTDRPRPSGLTGFALAVWVFQRTGSATQLTLIAF